MKNALAIWFVTVGLIWSQSTSPAPVKSRVVWIERPAVVDKFAVDAGGVSAMFIKALRFLSCACGGRHGWPEVLEYHFDWRVKSEP